MTSAVEGGEWSASRPGLLYSRERQDAGWAPGTAWTGAENLTPTGIGSLDRPARSQLLYRLRYPAHDARMHSDLKLEAFTKRRLCN
jgi:hypothetical protein